MAQSSKSHYSKDTLAKMHTNSLFLITVGLGLLTIVLIILALIRQDKVVTEVRKEAAQQVIVATPIEFSIKDGKGVRRTDEASRTFMTFLHAEADKSGCGVSSLPAAQYKATLFNSSETQARVHYGCGNTDALAFAVKKDAAWKMLPATNIAISETLTPLCSFVNDNAIEPSIAPVCATRSSDNAVQYMVR